MPFAAAMVSSFVGLDMRFAAFMELGHGGTVCVPCRLARHISKVLQLKNKSAFIAGSESRPRQLNGPVGLLFQGKSHDSGAEPLRPRSAAQSLKNRPSFTSAT